MCAPFSTTIAVFFSSLVLGASLDETPVLLPNGTTTADPDTDHVVNLDLSVSYELVRNGSELPALSINVTVPYVRDGSGGMCPSVYLIDTTDPLAPVPPSTSATTIASVDRLGLARSPCSVLNFTYDNATFGFESEYARVTPPWRLRVDGDFATYESVVPFRFADLVASCGVAYSPDQTHLLGAVYPTQRYDWTLYACQVGYYGARCESAFGEYAATCARAPGSARLGPMISSIAGGAFSESRPMNWSIAFGGFDTTDAGGCETGRTRGVVAFVLEMEDFDELRDLRYLNPPGDSGGVSRRRGGPDRRPEPGGWRLRARKERHSRKEGGVERHDRDVLRAVRLPGRVRAILREHASSGNVRVAIHVSGHD